MQEIWTDNSTNAFRIINVRITGVNLLSCVAALMSLKAESRLVWEDVSEIADCLSQSPESLVIMMGSDCARAPPAVHSATLQGPDADAQASYGQYGLPLWG